MWSGGPKLRGATPNPATCVWSNSQWCWMSKAQRGDAGHTTKAKRGQHTGELYVLFEQGPWAQMLARGQTNHFLPLWVWPALALHPNKRGVTHQAHFPIRSRQIDASTKLKQTSRDDQTIPNPLQGSVQGLLGQPNGWHSKKWHTWVARNSTTSSPGEAWD